MVILPGPKLPLVFSVRLFSEGYEVGKVYLTDVCINVSDQLMIWFKSYSFKLLEKSLCLL